MSRLDAAPLELQSLLAVACRDDAAVEDLAKLEDVVCDEPALELVIDFFQLDGELHRLVRQQSGAEKCFEMLGLGTASPRQRVEPATLQAPSSPMLATLGAAFHNTLGYFSQEIPFSLLVATAVIGLGLWIGSLFTISRDVEIARESVPTVAEPSAVEKIEHVGRITGMVGCQWEKKGLGIRDWGLEKGAGDGENDKRETINDKLSVQRSAFSVQRSSNPQSLVFLGDKFALTSGLMEITYNTGAKVILQGPVTYEVESNRGGYLLLGKLTAQVEKRGERRGERGDGENDKRETINDKLSVQRSAFSVQRSSNPQSPIPNPSLSTSHYPLFTIKTPTATVTDLGTEFGVEVGKEGQTTSHVFRGSVSMQATSVDGKADGVAQVLHENESARVEKGGGGECPTVRRVAADPAAFVRSEQLLKLAEELGQTPFRRWQAYSDQLRRDPSLLAYYDFQLRKGQPALLANVAESTSGSCDGAVENATWSDGRMSGKHALLFNGPSDYVSLNLPQKVDDLTLAAWVCAEPFADKFNVLLMSDQWGQDGKISWTLYNDGRMGFDIYESSESGGNNFSTPFFDPGRFRRWTYLAVVFDHATLGIRFYVDGRAIGDAKIGRHVPLHIRAARIGQWNFAGMPGGGQIRNFLGRIDELAIFGRSLKAEEIQRMYEAGKPAGAHAAVSADRRGKP